ncbi:uncharacterized protein ACNLHF_000667 isoform 2-T2 [Anomaloglossus baeobatrachus]|uniref:uncharacterized protein LOC142251705 isoform X2 n=1 Tax=Anomaloglossus baeobatrachus TaxID=238106 RepID=UPI003F5084E0
MSAALEELFGKMRAAALVRGEAWLREKVAEILPDEGKGSQDPPPCAKRGRAYEHRSPSPVPRNRRKDPLEVSGGPCPTSEGPCSAKNPLILDSNLQDGDEYFQIPVNAASRCGSHSGPSSEVAGIVSAENQKPSDAKIGQQDSSPSPNLRTVNIETCDNSYTKNVPGTTQSSNTEESIEFRIERLLRSCSAAIELQQEEDDPSEPTPAPVSSAPEGDAQTGLGSPDLKPTVPDITRTPQHPASSSIIEDPRSPACVVQGARSPSPSVSSHSTRRSRRHRVRHRCSRRSSKASASTKKRCSHSSRCRRHSRSSRRRRPSTSSESSSSDSRSRRHAERRERRRHRSRDASQGPSHAASGGVPVPLPSVLPSSPVGFHRPNIWILGHYYVFCAAQRSKERPGGKNLGFNGLEVSWRAIRGLKWTQVFGEVVNISRQSAGPTILVLHVGGNDLCRVKLADLLTLMRTDLNRFPGFFSELRVVWSEIISRVTWQVAFNADSIERTRKTLNTRMARYVRFHSGVVIRHRQLEGDNRHLIMQDGVHLTDAGLDIFLSGLQEGIEQALSLLGGVEDQCRPWALPWHS